MVIKFDIDIRMDQHRLFDLALSRSHLLLWRSGYSDVELISGIPGRPGAQYKLTYSRNKEVKIFETIHSIDPPYEYTSEYTMDGLRHLTKIQLLKIDEEVVRYLVILEIKSPSPLFELFLVLVSPVAKWQAKQILKRFKEFAEKGVAR